MARVRVPITVIDASGNAVTGASVQVQNRATLSNATLYQAETGGTTVANPTSTDSFGRVAAWIGRGAYQAVISGGGLATYTQHFEGAPAADGSGESAWLGEPVWVTGASIAASVPNPVNGQEVKYLASDSSGVIWHFKYRAASASAYKWEFIGGSGLTGTNNGIATLSTTGANTALTGDIAITVPLTGDYASELSAVASHSGNNQGIYLFPTGAGFSGNGSSEGAAYCVQPASASPNAGFPMAAFGRVTLTAAGTLNLGYFVGAAGGQLLSRRSLKITPIRVA